MFPHKFICKTQNDPLLQQLQSTFSATPFLPPSASIHPLDMVAHRGEKTMHLGPLAHILSPEGGPFGMSVEQANVAKVDLNRSSSFNLDLGFKLLDGLFNGFRVSLDPVKAAIKNATAISLSFRGTRRRFINHVTLGQSLRNHKIDLEHPSIKGLFGGDKKMGMYVIGSVLESKQFNIQLSNNNSVGIDVDAPLIGKVTEAGLKVEHEGKRLLSIAHEGEEFLVFGFSCFILNKDSTGGLSIEEEVTWTRGEEEDENEEKNQTPEVSLIHPKLPAILAWDSL